MDTEQELYTAHTVAPESFVHHTLFSLAKYIEEKDSSIISSYLPMFRSLQ